jgi:hypothetical protein
MPIAQSSRSRNFNPLNLRAFDVRECVSFTSSAGTCNFVVSQIACLAGDLVRARPVFAHRRCPLVNVGLSEVTPSGIEPDYRDVYDAGAWKAYNGLE